MTLRENLSVHPDTAHTRRVAANLLLQVMQANARHTYPLSRRR